MATPPKFAELLAAEVTEQYYKHGSKLRNTVRTKNRVTAPVVSFEARDGTPAVCRLTTPPCGRDWHEDVALLQQNPERRAGQARALAQNLGFDSNRQIATALTRTPNYVVAPHGLTAAALDDAHRTLTGLLGVSALPADEGWFAMVEFRQWTELLTIPEFITAPQLDAEALPHPNIPQHRLYRNTLWFPHADLPAVHGLRRCVWYHRSAVGHAAGVAQLTITPAPVFFGKDQIDTRCAQGARLIDPRLAVAIHCREEQPA